jgi:hypothetical protein
VGETKKSPAGEGTSDSTSPLCFVLMPYGGRHGLYYEKIIEPALRAAALRPLIAGSLDGPSSIIQDIWRNVRDAHVLLANLTGRNPNVFYELGLAHALGKPVVLVAQTMEDVPFDLRSLRVITYDQEDPAWGETLRDRITASMREVLDSPERFVPATYLHTQKQTADVAGPAVGTDERRLLELEQQIESLRATVEPRRRVVVLSGQSRPDLADVLSSFSYFSHQNRAYPGADTIDAEVVEVEPPPGQKDDPRS